MPERVLWLALGCGSQQRVFRVQAKRGQLRFALERACSQAACRDQSLPEIKRICERLLGNRAGEIPTLRYQPARLRIDLGLAATSCRPRLHDARHASGELT